MYKWIVAGGVAAVIAAASACQPVSGAKLNPHDMAECPHEWGRIFGGKNPGPAKTELAAIAAGEMPWVTPGVSNQSSVAGTRTDVPEYHDCQRMRRPAGGAPATYGALAAVFAADSLERPADSSIVAARVIGEVFSDSEYPPLHFKKDFSCLVIAPDGHGLKAWMVPVGVDEQRCKTMDSLEPTEADRLTVRVVSSKFSGNDIPPVARWDWDETKRVQFIGIRCGNQWCEIGPREGFGPSPTYDGERTIAVKGWYDEQRLAVGHKPIAPGENVATVVPAANLTQKTTSEFDHKWTAVAQVWMQPGADGYISKYNFREGSPPGSSAAHATLEVCRGSWWQCPGVFLAPLACTPDPYVATASLWNRFWTPKIYARITSPAASGGTTSKYLCVVRREGMADPPPVARWRWRASDETIWVRCAQGCCEVDANFF